MPEPELVRLDPDDWRDFRGVRLAALADSPWAFGSRHVDWVDAPAERWRSRLTDVPLTILARSGDATLHRDTVLMVRDDNARAIAAYARAGFADLGVPADWPAGEQRERRMRRGHGGG